LKWPNQRTTTGREFILELNHYEAYNVHKYARKVTKHSTSYIRLWTI